MQELLGKYQVLLSAYKHKALRVPPPAVDFDLSDIIGDTTSNISNDSVRQAQIAIENLTKEITAQEILLTQRQRDLEQESKQVMRRFLESNWREELNFDRKLMNFKQLNENGNRQRNMANVVRPNRMNSHVFNKKFVRLARKSSNSNDVPKRKKP